MKKPTDINPYTVDFDFFDRLYGGQGEIFNLVEGPNIKIPFRGCMGIIEELEKEYPKEKERLSKLCELVCDVKHNAILECFDAGVSEMRKLMGSLSGVGVEQPGTAHTGPSLELKDGKN